MQLRHVKRKKKTNENEDEQEQKEEEERVIILGNSRAIILCIQIVF